MNNPWAALPTYAPYLLDSDKPQIEAYNRNADPAYQIHDDLLPEPYLGNPANASVILLNLNPGFSQNDYDFYSDACRRQACLDNLVHAPADYPFYLLNPAFREYSGPTWWHQKLKWLIQATSLEQVATQICCVEFFPYHSQKFGAGSLRLPSQAYSFQLVQQAVEAGKLFLIMRAKTGWERVVPALKNVPCYTMKSKQRAWISANNINDGGFAKIVEAITL